MWFKSNFDDNRLSKNLRSKKMEHCKNPWKNTCKSENIQLYIQLKGEKLPICKKCWGRLAEKELSWGD